MPGAGGLVASAPVVRPSFLDPAHQAALERDGYVVVPLLSPDEAADVLARIQRLRPADGFRPDGVTGLNRATYHCTFLDADLTYKRELDALMREVFATRLATVLDCYRLLTSNLYAKAPGAGRLEIHQNWPTTADIRETSFTVWCPFTDVSPGNGTIQLVPGSHKILPDISTVSAEKYFIDFYDGLIERWLQPVSLRAGECLVFDDSLIHWSDHNGSDDFRWCVQVVFSPEESLPVIYWFDDAAGRFEVFEVDPGFYVENGIDQLISRPTGLPLVGTIAYENVRLTEEQFARVMELGPETRRRVYAGEPAAQAFAAALEVAGRAPAAMALEEVA